jgi:TonB family protein
MSELSTLSAERVPQPANRRKYPRRKPDQLIYIDMGGSNGGFVLDVSEAGLSFQGIMPLSGGGQTVHVKFKLPGAGTTIQAEGQLVHPGNSEMGGGLRLVNLTAEEQQQLRAWVTRQEDAERPVPVEAEPVSEDARAKISEAKEADKVAAEPVDAKPELPAATLPAIVASAESQTKQSAPASLRRPVVISEMKVSALPRAAIESVKNVRQPVLQSSVVRKQRPAKSSLTTQFAAGLVAGCLALIAIGGGLVAAGRLRLSWSSPESSSASAQPDTTDTHAANLAPSSLQTPAQAPAAPDAPSSVAETSTPGNADDPSSATGMVPPTLVSHSDPEYPQEAKAANVQGSVDVLATIGTDGVPRALRATSGDTRLADAAIAAISQWHYKPAMLNGQPAEALISITVTFAP